jgi:uncharacterized protein DUF6678
MEFTALLNNTKWDELRLAMYQLDDLTPRWRTRCIENGHVTDWDREWFYHFKSAEYKAIEWVEIEISSEKQHEVVHSALTKINLPGERIINGFRVYGHIAVGTPIKYV